MSSMRTILNNYKKELFWVMAWKLNTTFTVALNPS